MQDIKLFINSPGGSVTAGMGIYDAMMVSIALGSCVAIYHFLHSRSALFSIAQGVHFGIWCFAAGCHVICVVVA